MITTSNFKITIKIFIKSKNQLTHVNILQSFHRNHKNQLDKTVKLNIQKF